MLLAAILAACTARQEPLIVPAAAQGSPLCGGNVAAVVDGVAFVDPDQALVDVYTDGGDMIVCPGMWPITSHGLRYPTGSITIRGATGIALDATLVATEPGSGFGFTDLYGLHFEARDFSIVAGHRAASMGMGIGAFGPPTVWQTTSMIVDNVVSDDAGLLSFSGANVSITNTTLIGNVGMNLEAGESITLANNTLLGGSYGKVGLADHALGAGHLAIDVHDNHFEDITELTSGVTALSIYLATPHDVDLTVTDNTFLDNLSRGLDNPFGGTGAVQLIVTNRPGPRVTATFEDNLFIGNQGSHAAVFDIPTTNYDGTLHVDIIGGQIWRNGYPGQTGPQLDHETNQRPGPYWGGIFGWHYGDAATYVHLHDVDLGTGADANTAGIRPMCPIVEGVVSLDFDLNDGGGCP